MLPALLVAAAAAAGLPALEVLAAEGLPCPGRPAATCWTFTSFGHTADGDPVFAAVLEGAPGVYQHGYFRRAGGAWITLAGDPRADGQPFLADGPLTPGGHAAHFVERLPEPTLYAFDADGARAVSDPEADFPTAGPPDRLSVTAANLRDEVLLLEILGSTLRYGVVGPDGSGAVVATVGAEVLPGWIAEPGRPVWLADDGRVAVPLRSADGATAGVAWGPPGDLRPVDSPLGAARGTDGCALASLSAEGVAVLVVHTGDAGERATRVFVGPPEAPTTAFTVPPGGLEVDGAPLTATFSAVVHSSAGGIAWAEQVDDPDTGQLVNRVFRWTPEGGVAAVARTGERAGRHRFAEVWPVAYDAVHDTILLLDEGPDGATWLFAYDVATGAVSPWFAPGATVDHPTRGTLPVRSAFFRGPGRDLEEGRPLVRLTVDGAARGTVEWLLGVPIAPAPPPTGTPGDTGGPPGGPDAEVPDREPRADPAGCGCDAGRPATGVLAALGLLPALRRRGQRL